jgi:hypothetical protein
MKLDVCNYCGRLRELDGEGRIIRHRIPTPVTRATIDSFADRAKRKPLCRGSGQRPRRVEP